MDGHVLLLVLAAALLHATWNSIVKGGSNKLFESSMNALGGGLGALLILPFLPAPAPESWGLLALSCCFHLTYYICISQAYDKVDLSIGYTIMRGCAPMITALALLLLGNHISLQGQGQDAVENKQGAALRHGEKYDACYEVDKQIYRIKYGLHNIGHFGLIGFVIHVFILSV